jgi:hypothetical protein
MGILTPGRPNFLKEASSVDFATNANQHIFDDIYQNGRSRRENQDPSLISSKLNEEFSSHL